MREIVERLTENRQVELAKSILESNGYEVTKNMNESAVNPVITLISSKLKTGEKITFVKDQDKKYSGGTNNYTKSQILNAIKRLGLKMRDIFNDNTEFVITDDVGNNYDLYRTGYGFWVMIPKSNRGE